MSAEANGERRKIERCHLSSFLLSVVTGRTVSLKEDREGGSDRRSMYRDQRKKDIY